MELEQTALFGQSNTDRLSEYLRINRFTRFNASKIAQQLNMSKLEVLQSWNELNKEQRLLTISDPSEPQATVLESLDKGERLPSNLSPANKYAREHYYKQIANRIGYPLHMVLHVYGQAYDVLASDWEPELFRGGNKHDDQAI